VRDEVEHEVRGNPESDRATEQRAARAELDDEPRDDGGSERGSHGVRPGHVREVDVGHAPHRTLRGGALDAGEVEEHPGELHRLDRDEQRRDRHRGIAALEQQRGGGVVDGEHVSRASA
jgi:hypothetical protein